ncbi:glycosyl hydrolase [Enterovibrio baiacu]|uniref:glycosyl hydrolase n=1 Tax=Enterovibrio baiacu TaxID=2491023 RepID=UPI003D138D0C
MNTLKLLTLLGISFFLYGCGGGGGDGDSNASNYALTVSVTNSLTGQPIENANVSVDNVSQMTNSAGTVTHSVPNGNLSIVVSHDDYASKRLNFSVGNADRSLSITLLKTANDSDNQGIDSGTDGGTDNGGTDSGTDGGTDNGGTDSGTDGGTDNGGTDSGTDGGTDNGGIDSGTDGGTDNGSTDSGTDGGTDNGGTDSGTDGGTDNGGDNASEETRGYVFHSEMADSFKFDSQGNPWTSGATVNEVTEGDYERQYSVTSGNNWGGDWAVVAWGHENDETSDAGIYDVLRFKFKSAQATTVEVSIQSKTEDESKITYALSSATDLGNGWKEMEVTFPHFEELTWIGLMFPLNGTVDVADVYLVDTGENTDTHQGDYTITQYGAGNISDTFNPDGYGCTVDHGFWISNAGVVRPEAGSCDNIATPVPLFPHLAEDIKDQPVPTHKWWGSVSFLGEMTIGDADSAAYITPDPLTARVSNKGFRVMGISNGLSSEENAFLYSVPAPFDEVFDGIAIANSQFTELEGYLKDHSDGSVTVEWSANNSPVMEATFVHGSPYVYVKAYQGNIVIKTLRTDGVEKGTFYNKNNSLGIWTNVAGNRNDFLIVGEGDTQFNGASSSSITVINSANEVTVSLLPSTNGTPSDTVSAFFEGPARNVVRHVNVDYSVDRNTNDVTVTHAYVDSDGVPVETIAGMHPMHWKNSTTPTSEHKVRSARGVVKFAEVSDFSYTIPFVGVLPYMPTLEDNYDLPLLRGLVTEYMNKGTGGWNPYTDTYWSGKSYGKAAEIIAIARSIGMDTEANTLTAWLKSELEDWFTADTSGGLDTVKYFVYDETWTTLLGVEESFGAHQQLNDHHFHYGYFVRAAAEICRTDKSWCGADQYGPMIELLIRDYAASKGDDMFPYLRNFDPANGFSWASGHANFALGNNNESTSEAANSYGAIVLYGLITGNDELTEKGMYLHASSSAAYWEYWNNIDGYRNDSPNYVDRGDDYDNFPSGYNRITTSIIWGHGTSFSTWFSGAYAHILGIQGLPLNPLVFHVGQYADYMEDYVSLGLEESNNGKPSGLVDGQWRDIWWNLWAMTDANASIADYETVGSNYVTEEGESKAHTYHWIHTWKALGQLETGTGELTADSPTAVAFKNGNTMTYVVYNFSDSAQTVRFSDGQTVNAVANDFTLVER